MVNTKTVANLASNLSLTKVATDTKASISKMIDMVMVKCIGLKALGISYMVSTLPTNISFTLSMSLVTLRLIKSLGGSSSRILV